MTAARKFIGNSLVKLGKKIVAVGKNYEAHALEMGGKSAPSEPVLFLKPTTSYIRDGESVLLPPGIGEVHHELELGVVIGRKGTNISQGNWQDHVAGYVVALDMTARTIQNKAKEEGLPWTTAKCWDTFTPISEFVPVTKAPAWDNLDLWLCIDGVQKQRCRTGDMVHGVPSLISYISHIMTLEEGDMILCGTPENVGPVAPGMVLTTGIDGLIEARFNVKQREDHSTSKLL